nr:hypothetical protein [Tanacetum cinerariifolium]
MHKYTRFDAQSFKDAIICTMDSIRKYMLEIILHQKQTPYLLKQKKLTQTQEDHSNPIRALNVDSLKVDSVVIQNPCSETEDNNSETASSKSVKESSLDSATKDTSTLLNTLKSRLNTLEIHYSNTMVMSRSPFLKVHVIKDNMIEGGTKSEVQDDNSRSGNDTDVDDADIRPIYNEDPMATVQLTAECNIFAIGQQHTEQPKIINERQHGQVLNDESNKVKIKKEIDVLETINIELEHKVANFCKENENLKKHYKDLYDSIKIMRSKNIEQTTSLLSNNAALKPQIQENRKRNHCQSRFTNDEIEMTFEQNELESLFDPSFDEYSNGENQVVLKPSAVTTADRFDKRLQQPDSTSPISFLATSITTDGNFDLSYIPYPSHNFIIMSNTNNNMQTQTSNTLHNAIMEAGSKDRPPMLAPGWIDKEIPIFEGSPTTRSERFQETYKNVSQKIHDQLNAKAEAIQIILTGINNDIYSTVNACSNACEMWNAIERIGNVSGARETVGSMTMQKSRIQCYNCKEFRHVVRECQKPKRAKDAAYHREKMLLCKQEEAGIQLNAEQADWRDDTDDDEFEDQELEAHYMYMVQLQEVSPDAADSGPIFDDEPLQKVSNDDHYNVFAMESEHLEQSESVHNTYPIDQDAHNVIIDSLDISYDGEEIDQNDDDNDLANERELLASLIKKLKCKINENKNRNKFLETSNKVLIEQLKGEIEDFKNKNKSLESSNNHFKEANNKLPKTNNLLYTNYKKSEAELARRNSKEYALQMEIECAKVRGDFLSYKMEYQKSCTKYTQTINDLNQTTSKIKDKLSAHQETIFILSQQKEAQIQLYKTRKDKALDKVIELENKVKVLDNIVYKTGGYNVNLALMLALESDEVIRLEKESRLKLIDLIRSFDYNKLNNLYDLFVPQHEKSSEQRYFSKRSRLSHTNVNNGKSKESFIKQTTLLEKQMDESISLDKMCQSSIENFKVKTYVNTIINGVELCKEKIANRPYSGYIDPFIQKKIKANFSPLINEVTNLQCNYLELLEKCEGLKTELSKSKMMSKSFEALHKHAINLEIDLQQYFPKSKSVTQNNVSNDFSKPITAQTLPPNKKSILKNTNVLAYKLHTDHTQARTSQLPQDSRKTNKRVSFSTGVIPTTSVSRTQLKSNLMGDRVIRNNSQGKKHDITPPFSGQHSGTLMGVIS